MRWSYKCGKLLGIDLYVHITFILLLAYFLFEGLVHTHNMTLSLLKVGLVVITFAIVVLHELGHSMAASRFGVKTRHIMILPIGGVASLESMPEKPHQELLVALAGPAVNLVLALLFGTVLFFYSGALPVIGWGDPSAGLIGLFLHWLIILNTGLLTFNLIPAFPMDGGRVLRSLLGFKFDYLRATEIAVKVARFVALLFVLSALFGTGGNMLLLIALFIWQGGSSELNMIRQREMMRKMAEQYGHQGMDIHQGVVMPNGERLIIVPGGMGFRVVKKAPDSSEKHNSASSIDVETMYRNMATAQCREERGGDDEPRAKVIDVQ